MLPTHKKKVAACVILALLLIWSGCEQNVEPNALQSSFESTSSFSFAEISSSQPIGWNLWDKTNMCVNEVNLGQLFTVNKLLANNNVAVLLFCSEQNKYCLGSVENQSGGSLRSIELETTLDIAIAGNQIITLHKDSVAYYDLQLKLLGKEIVEYSEQESITLPQLSADGGNILYIAQDRLPRCYNIASGQLSSIKPITLPDGQVASEFFYIAQKDERSPMALIAQSESTDSGTWHLFYDSQKAELKEELIASKSENAYGQKLWLDIDTGIVWHDTVNDGTLWVGNGLAVRYDGGYAEIANLAQKTIYRLGSKTGIDIGIPQNAAQMGNQMVCYVTEKSGEYRLLFATL